MSKQTRVPRVLTIAGTDPTGGAGAQADIKSITVAGGFALSAITAVVSQNTQGVRSIYTPDAPILASQLDAISDDVTIDAVKIGMLGNCDYIATVSAWLKKVNPAIVVLDPVMVATSGDRLLEPEAEAALKAMLPLASLITPNIPELEVLVDKAPESIDSYDEAVACAQGLARDFGCLVMVKGGHLNEPYIHNAIVGAEGVVAKARSPKVDTRSTHGTGCSISSALAARLAIELGALRCESAQANTSSPRATQSAAPSSTSSATTATSAAKISIDESTTTAIQRALTWSTEWIFEAIVNAEQLHVGQGNGPIDHSHRMRRLEAQASTLPWRYTSVKLQQLDQPFEVKTPATIQAHIQPSGPWTKLLWNLSQETMEEINQLPFLTQLRQGTLSQEKFTAYQRQDALYLAEYGRILAALAARAHDGQELIFWGHSAALALEAECELHRDWLSTHSTGSFAILASLPKSPVTAGYTDFLLARSLEDYVVGCAAVLPCFWLYCEIGQAMAAANYPGHTYEEWLTMYGDPSFAQSTRKAINIVETHMAQASASTRELAVRAYLGAAEWEREFFNQAEGLVI